MKRIEWNATTILVLVIVLVSAAGCGGGVSTEDPQARHTGADEHDDKHAEGSLVRLDAEAQNRLGLEVAEAGPGTLEISVELPGEVQVNGDRMAHVGPRVGGIAREVYASLGDRVRAGQVLAVLESRELADAKAAFLAAHERMALADATFEREERLWHQKVSSEQDFLDARKGRAEARIELRAAEQKLHALGAPQSELDGLPVQHDTSFTEYRLTAPFDGAVIDRHITVGETVSAGSPVFTVADLGTVWIDLSVYQKDIGSIRDGQTVRVDTPHGDEVELTIDFVQPIVGEDTRTAKARIVAPNGDGIWHPGCFVKARVVTSRNEVPVLVPTSAVIRMEDGDDVVFVQTDDGFEPRQVTLGRVTSDHVEVLAGLEPGERYVAAGGFNLKAELSKATFGDGHGH